MQNRLGFMRECEVVFRGTFGGHPALGVMECNDWGHKVGTPELDAFITKTGDINARWCPTIPLEGCAEARQASVHESVTGRAPNHTLQRTEGRAARCSSVAQSIEAIALRVTT
jgi:hypothetical protein